jgi:leucyl aminopeptidase (aminopeptidase T)
MTLVQALVQAAEDRPVLALAVVSLLILVVAKAASSNQEYPSLPWVGKDDSKSFAATRATLSSISNVKNWLAEGYQKVESDRVAMWGSNRILTDYFTSTPSKANHTSFRTFLDAMRLLCRTTS